MKLSRLRPTRKPPTEGVVHVALVRPARAVTVYVLFAIIFIYGVLGTSATIILWHRTQEVCGPLRSGQALAPRATSDAGRGFASTFGDAANKLGCPR